MLLVNGNGLRFRIELLVSHILDRCRHLPIMLLRTPTCEHRGQVGKCRKERRNEPSSIINIGKIKKKATTLKQDVTTGLQPVVSCD